MITVEDSGQNNIAVASGANLEVSVQDVTAALDALSDLDLLVMNLEVPLESVIVAAHLAKGRGARVVLNPAPARALPDDLLAAIDVIAPNEFEAETLTGIPVTDDANARLAAQKLHERSGCSVVITMGARGALVLDATSSTGSPIITLLPAHKVKAIDTTAAGDAFVGGLAVGLGEGRSLVDAARLGSAAGAISATRLGAQPSLPKRAEAEELLNQG